MIFVKFLKCKLENQNICLKPKIYLLNVEIVSKHVKTCKQDICFKNPWILDRKRCEMYFVLNKRTI